MNLNNAKRTFKGLVASAIVLEVILVTIIIKWYALRQQPVESMLCFNDESLKSAGWNSEILQNLTMAYGKDTTQNGKCFKTIEVINNFVMQQMTFRYNTNINPEPLIFDLTTLNCTISSAKPGILILTDIKLVHAPDMSELGKEPNIFWTAVSKQGKGLNYLAEEGMIAIQTTGYFFVTSQLTFLKENKTNSDEIGKHRVIRIANKTDQQSILLESTMSRCEMPAKQCEQTSFIAAAFKFEENDKIFVTVSHKFQILSGNGTHFFSVVEI